MLFSRRSCWLSVLLLAVISMPVQAKKGGGGKPGDGGGDPEPTTPPVNYSLYRFTLPADYFGGLWDVEEVNELGEVVGHYADPVAAGGEQPYYLDTRTGNTVATNLNDLEFDTVFSIPPGWYIDAATGINNLGDISCALAKVGDPEQLRGGVIVLRPEVAGPPQIHLMNDGAWSHTYARRINDVGVVLGRGDSVTSYVYQMPLHGQGTDGIVHVIPTAFDAWWAHLSNPINGGPTLVNKIVFTTKDEVLTYNADNHTESHLDISALGISNVTDFNDGGSFCGSYNAKGKNRGSKGYLFDGVFHSLGEMEFGDGLNNSGDVIGLAGATRRPVLDHPVHGAILIDDTIITAKVIWDSSGGHRMPTLSERNASGFPVIAGMMLRPDSPFASFYEGYVLFPSIP